MSLWKRIGYWLFGFDLDSEFLRGVAFGRKWRDEELMTGNTSAAGTTKYIRIDTPWHKASTRSEGAE